MERKITCDVAIVGGGSAGIAAAFGAAAAGADVLLLEREACFGGQATNSNVAFYCGFFTNGNPPEQSVKGVGGRVLEKMAAMGEYDGPMLSPAGNAIVAFDPEALKYVLDCMVSEGGFRFLLYSHVIDAITDDNRIASLECMDDEGRFEVTAKAFVDASGDANLAHLSRTKTVFGSADGTAQFATMMLRIDGIMPDSPMAPVDLYQPLSRAKAEGYNITKEKGLLMRRSVNDSAYGILPSVAVNSLDAQTLTDAEMNVRLQAQDYIRAFRNYMPGMKDCCLTATGPRLGLRETRRIVGKATVTDEAVLSAAKRDDSIARGSWQPELHARLETMADYLGERGDRYYSIPLGALTPVNTCNLWCGGRTISAEKIAFSSVRVMGTAFATGHAAGVAAALYALTKQSETAQVQKELVRQNALI